MPQATDIILFDRPKISFQMIDFEGDKMVDLYDKRRPMVVFLQKILERTPEELRRDLGAIGPHLEAQFIDNMEECKADFEAFAELFGIASARLQALHQQTDLEI